MKYKPQFYLKNRNQSTTSIICTIYFNRDRFRLTTGMVVKPSHWSTAKQRVKAGDSLASVINDKLEKINIELARIIIELKAEGMLTPGEIRKRYEATQVQPAVRRSMFDLYDSYIDSLKDKWQESTIKIHRTAYNHLMDFAKKYKVELDFDTCNVLFFDQFLTYLTTVAGKLKKDEDGKKGGITNTTAWKVIRTFRVFLKHALDQGWTSSRDFEKFTGKKMPKGETSEKPYTTLAELDRIKGLDLSDDKRMAVTRDLYLFQCNTGLRWADVQAISPDHIHGEEIQIVTGKNKKAIRVPLLPTAKEILQRYEYRLPRRSNQKQNDYLKQLCKKAKITRHVVVVSYKGAKRVEKTVPKHDLIGTHCAKRTFVSILRSAGVTVETICRLTGNSRATIERYILKDEADMRGEIETAIAALS